MSPVVLLTRRLPGKWLQAVCSGCILKVYILRVTVTRSVQLPWNSVADLYGRALPEGKHVDPHQVLGISEDASSEEIRAAYESCTEKCHAGSGGDAWALQQV